MGDRDRRPPAKEWMLDLGWPALDDVQLFVSKGTPISSGEPEFVAAHPSWRSDDVLGGQPVLPIPLPPDGQTWMYYLRVKSDAAMLMPFVLRSPDAYQRHAENLMLGYGAFYGLVLGIMIMNLVAYVWLRDKSPLWYAGILLFVLVYFAQFNLLQQRFFPVHSAVFSGHMAHFLLASALALLGPFCRSFLSEGRWGRVLNRLWIVYIAIACANIVMAFVPFASLPFMKLCDSIVGCGAVILTSCTVALSLRGSFRPGRAFALAWIVLSLFAIKHVLTLWGFLAVTQWSYHNLQICTAIVSVAFCYGVWHRLKLLREEDEHHVRESEARYRLLAENITDVIWTMDLQGRLTYISPSVQRLEGYSVEEAMSRRFEEYMPPESAERARRALAEDVILAEQSGGHRQVLELEQFKKDGTPMWAEITASQVWSDGTTEIVGITRDVTERKRQEDERRRLEARIQDAQKMESLGILAGGVAHDFNNLLTIIIGNAGMLLSVLDPDSAERKMAEEIESAGSRAADLSRQMLAYSGRGNFVIKLLSLNDNVEDMADLLKASLPKKAALRLELANSLPLMKGDSTQVPQVVMNLAVNASDALGEEEGTITISTGTELLERGRLSKMHWGADLPPGEYVYLEVKDTGCGMDKETQERIFDPFFTTKFVGRGLGLSATLGIVRAHSGAIEVHSTLGAGSVFRVFFPVSDEGVPEDGAKMDPEVTSGKGVLLIVDDEEGVRRVAAAAARELDLRVLEAGDGREGVDVFREHAEEITAVLLDLSMPRLDGDEVIGEFKAIRPDVPVILFTGYGEERARKRFSGKGLAGFIAKPFRREELREKMRSVLWGS